jgi:hypothetical protein
MHITNSVPKASIPVPKASIPLLSQKTVVYEDPKALLDEELDEEL